PGAVARDDAGVEGAVAAAARPAQGRIGGDPIDGPVLDVGDAPEQIGVVAGGVGGVAPIDAVVADVDQHVAEVVEPGRGEPGEVGGTASSKLSPRAASASRSAAPGGRSKRIKPTAGSVKAAARAEGAAAKAAGAAPSRTARRGMPGRTEPGFYQPERASAEPAF